MKLDPITLNLFAGYPREFATIHEKQLFTRQTVYDSRYMENLIDENNGVYDIYTSVYALDQAIDKICFELDGLEQSLIDARKLVHFADKEDIMSVLIASGRRGIHVYYILERMKYDNPKELLTAVTHSIMDEVFGKNGASSVDPHLVGNVKALIRIPNTLRPPENRSYCTYIPNEILDQLDGIGLVMHTKSVHFLPFIKWKAEKTLYDLSADGVVPHGAGNYEPMAEHEIQNTTNFWVGKDISKLLPKLLKPCLAKRIIESNPDHFVRAAASLELMQHFKPEEIVSLYSRLNWRDYDESITMDQLESLEHFKPYSCRKIKRMIHGIECCEG